MSASVEIATLRRKIDALDEAVARLLNERAEVSRQIQEQRVLSGAPRVDLRREGEVIDTYTGYMGERGRDVAGCVLTFCRGAVDARNSERASQAVHADAPVGAAIRSANCAARV